MARSLTSGSQSIAVTPSSDSAGAAQIPNPDVAETNGIAVILEHYWQPVGVRLVRVASLVRGRSQQSHVVLYQNAVMEHGHARWRHDQSARVEARRPEDDVVGLPLTRRPTRVHEWRILPVNGARLAVGIRDVLVGVEQ